MPFGLYPMFKCAGPLWFSHFAFEEY